MLTGAGITLPISRPCAVIRDGVVVPPMAMAMAMAMAIAMAKVMVMAMAMAVYGNGSGMTG